MAGSGFRSKGVWTQNWIRPWFRDSYHCRLHFCFTLSLLCVYSFYLHCLFCIVSFTLSLFHYLFCTVSFILLLLPCLSCIISIFLNLTGSHFSVFALGWISSTRFLFNRPRCVVSLALPLLRCLDCLISFCVIIKFQAISAYLLY